MTKRWMRTYLSSLMLNVYITHVLTKLIQKRYIFGLVQVQFIIWTAWEPEPDHFRLSQWSGLRFTTISYKGPTVPPFFSFTASPLPLLSCAHFHSLKFLFLFTTHSHNTSAIPILPLSNSAACLASLHVYLPDRRWHHVAGACRRSWYVCWRLRSGGGWSRRHGQKCHRCNPNSAGEGLFGAGCCR